MAPDLTVEQANELSRRNPNRIIAELTDVAAWLERTKPQGLLYESAMPTMRDAAEILSEMIFGVALILAAGLRTEGGCTCHPDFTSQGSPLEGPCEFCCSDPVDAALASVSRELPGWTYAIDASAPELGIDVELFAPGDDKRRFTGTSRHLPTAIRHAVLNALQGPTPVDVRLAGEVRRVNEPIPPQTTGEGNPPDPHGEKP